MTSSKTFGITINNIPTNSSGLVITNGRLKQVNTYQFGTNKEGSALWLSPTVSGGITLTKPYAPNHSVFVGTILRSHNTQGVVEVNIQNGYELEELHNVAVTGATNGQFLQYNSGSGLWVPSSSGNFTYISATTGTMSGLYVRVSPDNNFVNLNNALTIDTDNFFKNQFEDEFGELIVDIYRTICNDNRQGSNKEESKTSLESNTQNKESNTKQDLS